VVYKDRKQWLEKALSKGKISQEYYNSRIKRVEEEIREEQKREAREVEEGFKRTFQEIPAVDLREGHFVVKLKCPSCGTEGENVYGKLDFKVLGKDTEGFMYFECPDCKKHLQFDVMTGTIKYQKGLLGFLFGKFS